MATGNSNYSTRRFLPLALILFAGMVYSPAMLAQEGAPEFVRVVRLSGTFSEEADVKVVSNVPAGRAPVVLTRARIEADLFGALTRLRPLLTITNRDPSRDVKQVEWQLDVYDEVVRNANNTMLLRDDLKIAPGESGTASIRAAAVLPDRMRIVIQLTKILFSDGSSWSPEAQCSLSADLGTLNCESVAEHK